MTDDDWAQRCENLKPKPNVVVEGIFAFFCALFVSTYLFAFYSRILQ